MRYQITDSMSSWSTTDYQGVIRKLDRIWAAGLTKKFTYFIDGREVTFEVLEAATNNEHAAFVFEHKQQLTNLR